MIEIQTGVALQGTLSRRALALVEEWRLAHVPALMDNWKRARKRLPLEYIEPLE